MVSKDDLMHELLLFMGYYFPNEFHDQRFEHEDEDGFYFSLRDNELALEMLTGKGSILLQFEILLASLGYWWECISFELMYVGNQYDPCKRVRDTWQT